MKSLLVTSVFALAVLSSCGDARAWPPLWPKPASFSAGSTVLPVSPSLNFQLYAAPGTYNEDAMNAAWARTVQKNVLSQHTAATPQQPALTIVAIEFGENAGALPLQPSLGMNESYTLSITTSPPAATITCPEIFGCYHGLETLSQLISFNFDTQGFEIHNASWTISDSPRFQHRGLLIDTSRHWLPLDYIRRVIDSVTYAKLNTIHWHLVDAQSWPFDSPTYPNLAKKGAWSPQQRYTVSDITAMVSYAEARGLRMMVEFDTPGHTAAMCKGAPEVCPQPLCPDPWLDNWALDITKNASYEVVHGVMKDLVSIFPEKMIHLGGDEVDFNCWMQDKKIKEWLSQRGLDYNGGYEYWVKHVQKFAWDLGKEVVGWEEIWNSFGPSLNKSVIIQQWLPHSTALPLNVTSHGYRLIWSPDGPNGWYLDQLFVNWTTMYQGEPCKDLPDANCKLVLGGEGCMWGETVDASDGLQTIWPRLAAIAERLWSPRAETQDVDAAHDRIRSFRCLLNERGIPAAPVDNSLARDSPPQPGSCYRQ